MSGSSVGPSGLSGSASSSQSSAPVPGSLALNNPSLGKIDQQRKILEELEKQKKFLTQGNSEKSSGNNDNPSASGSSSSGAGGGLTVDPIASNLLTSNQRAALEAAAKSSYGYFIAQDSSFGNTILPVLPRPKPNTTPNQNKEQNK